MNESLDDQIKIAERDKLLIETDKIKTEKLKVEQEIESAENEKNLAWWKKSKVWTQFGSIFLGVGILTTYINLVIIPISEYNNLKAKRDLLDLNIQISQALSEKNHAYKERDQAARVNDSLRQLTQRFYQGSYAASLSKKNIKQNDPNHKPPKIAEQNLPPPIIGSWKSTIYQGQQNWEVRATTNTNSFDVTLTAPDGAGSGVALYKGNGKFIFDLDFKGRNRSIKLKYTWTVDGINSNSIYCFFEVLKSNDQYTPVGTTQPDLLLKK